MPKAEPIIRLDLNNPVFQEQLLTLQKLERHAALNTLNKIRQLTWNQLYRLALSSADQTQPQPRDASYNPASSLCTLRLYRPLQKRLKRTLLHTLSH